MGRRVLLPKSAVFDVQTATAGTPTPLPILSSASISCSLSAFSALSIADVTITTAIHWLTDKQCAIHLTLTRHSLLEENVDLLAHILSLHCSTIRDIWRFPQSLRVDIRHIAFEESKFSPG